MEQDVFEYYKRIDKDKIICENAKLSIFNLSNIKLAKKKEGFKTFLNNIF